MKTLFTLGLGFKHVLRKNVKRIPLVLMFSFAITSASAQFCNTDVTNGILSTNITATAENAPNEDRTKAFDNSLATKWLAFNTTPSITANLVTAKVVTYYSITSANDDPTRDPKNWVIEGSNDGVSFTVLDTRTGETFASRLQTKYYNFSNSTSYLYYRFSVTANNGNATIFQVGEIQYLTNDDCVVGNVYKISAGTPYAGVPVHVRNYSGTVASTTTNASGAFKFSVTDIPTTATTTEIYKSVYTVLVAPPANTYFLQGPSVNLNTTAMNVTTATKTPLQLWPNGAYINSYGNTTTPSGKSLLVDNNKSSLTPSSLDWVLRPTVSYAPVCTLIPTTLDGDGTFGNLSGADYLTQHPWQTSFHTKAPPDEAHPLLFKPLATATTAYGHVDSLDLTGTFLKTVLIDETRYNVTSFLGTQNDGIIYYNTGFDNGSYNLLNGFGGGWRKTYGHTTGDPYDQFLAVNGSPTGASPLLEFTANISFVGNYYVNFFGKNANSFVQNINTPVELVLKVYDPSNNLVATSNLTLPKVTQASEDQPTAPWTPQTAMFNVANTGTYTFKFDVPTTSVFGNDFYLDDITISGCPLYTISGNVYNDVNALTDNTVNGTGTNAGGLYAVLVDQVSNTVLSVTAVSAAGVYSFSGLTQGDYAVLITNTSPVVGTTVPASSLPSGWISTGENIGTAAGNDGAVNGYNPVGVISADVTNVNFGIQQPPVAVNDQSLNNPYGTTVTLNAPSNDSDTAPGTLDLTSISLIVPVGATGVVTDGQGDVTSMTIPGEGTWTVNPTTGAVTFTPEIGFVGNPTVQQYTIDDNAGAVSNVATLTITYLSPIQITGTVFNDANGNTVINAGENGTTAGTNLYVYLVNGSGVVVDSAKVLSDGTYALQGSQNSSYTIELSTVQYPIGTDVNTTPISNTPPSGWVTTGENGAGNTGSGDGTPNGVLAVTTVTTNVTQQNFGIQQPPVAVNDQSLNNPYGTTVTLNAPSNDSDAAPGTLDLTTVSLIVPVGATGVVTDGQGDVTSMTIPGEGTWTVNPTTGAVTFTPEIGFVGNPTVQQYTIDDNAGAVSNVATLTITYLSPIQITGTVFNDANGNTVINAGENGTTAGTNLYVYLVNGSGVVVDSAKVLSDGTYALQGSQNSSYTIELSTVQYPIGTNVNTTPISNTPPSGWLTTGENGAGNTGSGDGTPNGVVAVTTVTTNVTQQNFGIQQPPVANNVTAPSQINPGGSVQVTVPALNGTDAEDGVLSTGDIVTITTLPTTGTLYYNGVAVTVGQTIVNYDPTKLTVDPNDGNVTVVFTYTVTDAAGVESVPATVAMPFTNDVPTANVNYSITGINMPVTIPVLNNDTFGADGPSVGTITITDNANHGNAVVNNGGTPNDPTDDQIVYTPNTGYIGNDTLIYQICDINGDCDTALVIINISIPMPVYLSSFDAQPKANAVVLYWDVAQELGVKTYEIQRSKNGIVFETIGTVSALGRSSYQYNDNYTIEGTAYYRLKLIEVDGKETLSSVKRVNMGSENVISIYPNPAKSFINVALTKNWLAKRIVVSVYAQDGKKLIQKTIGSSQSVERIDLSAINHTGVYYLRLQSDDNVDEHKILIVK